MATVLPIQGTFDIAKGRNMLRTHIAVRSWSTQFNVRASALLTAIGELILTTDPDHLSLVKVEIVPQGKDAGIEMHTRCHLSHGDSRLIESTRQNLARVADRCELLIEDGEIVINAYLYVDQACRRA